MLSPNFSIDKATDVYSNLLLKTIPKIGSQQKIKQGSSIVSAYDLSPFFFYIQSGLFKTIKAFDNQSYVVGFTFEGDVDGDPATLLSPPLQEYSIVAIADSTVMVCPWENLEKEIGQEMYLRVINHFLIRYVHILQNRIIESIALTADQRYRKLIEQHSEKISEIPLSDLSAYLGITPQSMSRIRSAKF